MFRKYIRADGAVGFHATYPALHSRDSYLAFRQELTDRGIQFGETEAGRMPSLEIDFGNDVGLAHLVARILFGSVFRVNIERDCVAYFKHVLIDNVPKLTGVET